VEQGRLAHAITSHFGLPLLIKTPGGLVVEVTDGTADYNTKNYRVSFFYDGFTDLDGSQPDAWRYVPEVQDAGRPADTSGYR
jgi:hypothetical protein